MRDHPIPPVSEPMQYRAIGLVRGVYKPENSECFTRGSLIDLDGKSIEAVVLGRVMTLMKRHLDMDSPHLWVVYPRCRDSDQLHLQITGIWEPSTLDCHFEIKDNLKRTDSESDFDDEVKEGDNYFSIRGELIYTKPENNEIVVKVRQKLKSNGAKPLPFKIRLKGQIPLEHLRHFASLNVRRQGQLLYLEDFQIIAPISTRGGRNKKKNLSLGKRK